MKTIKIAIQKSGRLNEKSVALLKSCGLNFENYKSSLITKVANFPLEILFLRDDDIPEYVQDGIADLGIVGENVIAETGVQIQHLLNLGFGKCSLKIAVKKDSNFNSLQDLQGKILTTSYPQILQTFLDQHAIKAEIKTISGSVEIGPGLGLSDAIFDIVSTGATLRSNGLVPFADVMQSQAVLITKKDQETCPATADLLQRIQSVLKAQNTKYVVLNTHKNNLQNIVDLLPGVKSPTVVPLFQDNWVAVHSVIPESDFWEKIDSLKKAGAEGIVVMPIEKIIV